MVRFVAALVLFLLMLFPAFAEDAPPDSTLIENVRIFDGHDLITSNGAVRVSGSEIVEVSLRPLAAKAGEKTIDGEGRFLMPGLIDAHVHVSWAYPFSKRSQASETYITALAVANAKAMLLRGFTTVRDTGGTDFGLATAINEGYIPGPRIVFAGRTLTQTGGHADYRGLGDPPEPASRFRFGAVIADGEAQVLQAAREELRRGSGFIKVHAGGGVSSPQDPLHVVQYSAGEIGAAVVAAENWGTYVAAHAYTPQAITLALEAGVKTIEHGNLIDRPSARLAAKKGAYVVPNVVTYWALDQGEGLPAYLKEKNKIALEGMWNGLAILKEENVKIAFGTDLIADMHAHQNREFILRSRVFTGLEILRQATSVNGGLIALSGPLNAYGKVGVIEPGAKADLLLVERSPIDDITVMADPEANFAIIMKNGEIAKDSRRAR